jgi:hypothetical protein
MKKLNVLLAASLLASAVHAQQSANPSAPAASASASAMVNPFAGKPLSIEELQSELETARLRTAALEEQLKQTSLTSEIATVPLRKAAEAAQARVAARGEELKLESVEKAARDAAEVAAAEKAEQRAARAARAKAAKSTSANARASESAPALAPVPRPTLLSVLTIGASKTAVFDFGGNTLMIEDGGLTPLGPVKIVDDRTVSLAGGTLKVSTVTLSRFAQEVAPPGPASAGGLGRAAAPAARPAGVSGGATSGQGMNIAATGTAGAGDPTGEGAGARLPPLQLPPGMTVLPASGR